MSSEISNATFAEELYLIQGKTVVVSAVPWEQVSNSGRDLLQKILQAVGLSLDAVTVVHQTALLVDRIPGNPLRVIFFGETDSVKPYESSEIGNTFVIASPPLEQLLSDAAAKQKLWAGLKVLFSRQQ